MTMIEHLAAIVATLLGATWMLSNRLGKIEGAIRGHISSYEGHVKLDDERFKHLDGRLVRIEGGRK